MNKMVRKKHEASIKKNTGGTRYSSSSFIGNRRFFVYLNVIFLFAGAILFLINQYILKVLFESVIFHSYLNDGIAAFLLISYTNLLIIFLKKEKYLLIRYHRIILLILFAGIFWEYVTPLYRAESYSDPLDIVSYLTGASLYFLCCRIALRMNQHPGKTT